MIASFSLAMSLCLAAPDGSCGEIVAPGNNQPTSYRPQEGDLVFFDDHHPVWTALFAWAGTGPPLHMGIVVKQAGGKFAILEAGPDDTVWCTLQDLEPRLRQFRKQFDGTITIRRCKKELT